jgi:hypothetical protein
MAAVALGDRGGEIATNSTASVSGEAGQPAENVSGGKRRRRLD